MGRNNTVSLNARFIGTFTNATYPAADSVLPMSEMYIIDTVSGGLAAGFYSAIDGAWVSDNSSVDAAQVGFLQAGTGAVATTVQTKLRESVSVKDFGAVGDGVTDDTAAIQSAIDYAELLSNTIGVAGANSMLVTSHYIAPVLHFGRGSYKISQKLTFDLYRVKIVGEDALVFTELGDIPSDYLMLFNGGYDVSIEGLAIGSTETGCIEVNAPNISSSRVKIDNVKFIGAATFGGTAIKYTNQSSTLHISRCLFQNVARALDVVLCDSVTIDSGTWFDMTFPNTRAADSGYIKASSGVIRVADSLFASGPSFGNTRVAFFDIDGPVDLKILRTRIAFETGSATVVNWKYPLVTSTGSAHRPGITIDNCTLSPRGEDVTYGDGALATPVIRLYEMPNRIHFTNNDCRGVNIGLLVPGPAATADSLYAQVKPYVELTNRDQNYGLFSYKFEGNNAVRQFAIPTSTNVENSKWNSLFNSFNWVFQITNSNPDTAFTSLRVDTFFSGERLNAEMWEVSTKITHTVSGNVQPRRWIVRCVKDTTAGVWKFLTNNSDDAASLNGYTVNLTPQFADFATNTPVTTLSTTLSLQNYYLTFLVAPSASSMSIHPMTVKPLRSGNVSGSYGGLSQYRY